MCSIPLTEQMLSSLGNSFHDGSR